MSAANREIALKVRSASSSFYWAMRLLPATQRAAIFAVYAFCRDVDDIADDAHMAPADKSARLAEWRTEIDRLFDGQPQHQIARELAGPVADFGLRRADFVCVIDGMQMDAGAPMVAPSQDKLDLYCDRVACAVGRLCVHIFGEPGAEGHAVAHHLGLALQLTNILRDVAEDAAIGRLYLPAEALAAHNIPAVPGDVTGHAAYPDMWRELADLARCRFGDARQAIARCNRRKMAPARIMLEVYERVLMRMMALSDDGLRRPDCGKQLVGRGEKLAIALRYGFL